MKRPGAVNPPGAGVPQAEPPQDAHAHPGLTCVHPEIFLYIQLFGRLLKGLSISIRTESSTDLPSSDALSISGVQGQILGVGELQQLLHSS